MRIKSMKGKLIFVHKLFPVDPKGVLGGAETVSVETAVGLANAGWEVYFFGHLPKGNQIVDGVRFIDYGENYNLYEVFKEYKDMEFDACICVHAYPVKTLLSFENIKRFFLLPQDMHFIEHRAGPHFINRYLDGVICLSDYQKDAYLRWGIKEEKLIKIPYGIDTQRYRPLSERNINKIMFAGATIKEKGIDLLFEAFKKLNSLMPQLELHIYGDASLWGKAQEVKNHPDGLKVFFHGKVSKEELIKAYSESVLCIIPTVPELYQESLPRSSLEAQACGCPVVGTKSGGLPETFLDGQTGFLVDPLSVDNLVKTIKEALEDEDKLKAMSQKAVEFIKENFSFEKQVKRLEDYILSVPPQKERISGITYKDLKILYYAEVPLMPSKTSSCNRDYEILKILLERGANITYTHGFFINSVEPEVEDLHKSYENFHILIPIYTHLTSIRDHDLLWITEAWDLERLRKALNLARRAKLVYNIPVIFDIMDSIYKHMLRWKDAGIEITEDQIKGVYSIEKELYSLSDVVIFVSEEERDFAVKEFSLDINKTFIISNIHSPTDEPPNGQKKSVCFIGGILNPNNLLAIKYFLNKIYPLVLQRDSEIEFYAIGDRTNELKLDQIVEDKSLLKIYEKKVHLVGWVKNIGEEIRKHKLSVAPLISGSGIKGKILNSLEYGVPVVTTSLGVEGFVDVENSGIVVADKPEDIAQAIVELIKDEEKRKKLANKGLSYVRKHFSKSKAEDTLVRMLPMIRKALKLNFSKTKPCKYKVLSDYQVIIPEGYKPADDLDEVFYAVLSEYQDKYHVISFNYLDIYSIEPLSRPFLEDSPQIYKWMPAIIKKDLQKELLKEGVLRYFHTDTVLCYREHKHRGLRGKLIEMGLRNKMFFKKHPLMEKLAKKIYRLIT
jgi:glycosyltransferase involved in cell wall biosynthesis